MWEEGCSSGGAVPHSAEISKSKLHDAIFNELIQECKHSAPGARLSARLRTALERLSPRERRGVCCRTRDSCAPLFVACKRGNVEIVEFLIHVCNADIEQRGVYAVSEERGAVFHTVTPLWCAAVSGRMEVVRALAEAGADLNAGSDSGSTPVRSACFMTHVEVVGFLIRRGANIHIANHNGGTCLINAVQSAALCRMLLDAGASPDARDLQHKTALHYAAQEHRADTARLLLEHGADPHRASRAGDDALRTAAAKGARQVVALLMSKVRYGSPRLADAYELLGATQLDEFNDLAAALSSWRKATGIRHSGGAYIPKRPVRPPHSALLNAKEWTTYDELDAASGDMDALRTQALLVAVRVLGCHHRDTVFRLMYRGAAYADAFRYDRCVALWTWALQIRCENHSLLLAETCHTAMTLTRLLVDAKAQRLQRAGDLPQHSQVTAILDIISAHLQEARQALQIRPMYKKQAETFDRVLRTVTHLIYLLIETAESEEEMEQSRHRVRSLVNGDLLCSEVTGDSLLHLAVSRLNLIRSTYYADDHPHPAVFPHVGVVKLLLECGADAAITNFARSTPLHVAAIPFNYHPQIVELLIDGGAHVDQPNKFGESALDLLIKISVALCRDNSHQSGFEASRARLDKHLRLSCVAARALARVLPPRGTETKVTAEYLSSLPRTLAEFLDLHRP